MMYHRKTYYWYSYFINMFNLNRYTFLLETEGLRRLNYLSKKINNDKLKTFITNDWFKNFLQVNNKLVYLKEFEKSYTSNNAELVSSKYANKLSRNLNNGCNFNRSISTQVLVSNILKSRGLSKSRKTSILNTERRYHSKFWLSIGIDEYLHMPTLSNAVNDAESLANFAKYNLNFKTYILKNKNANKKLIEYYIKNFLYLSLNKDDLLVISFHGHGITKRINNYDFGFIVPYMETNNTTPDGLISMNDLSVWMQYIKANHILILLDCCFSGFTALRGKYDNYKKETVEIMLDRKSRIVINAGTENQQVSDGGWGSNSIFTGSILSFPEYQSKLGSVNCLYNYILKTVSNHVPNQTPTMGRLIGDTGGDIFLGL